MSKYNIEDEEVRRLYVDELWDVKDIAAKFGCSVPNIRRILKSRKITRGKAYIASGNSPVWNRGLSDPKAKRNRPKAEFMSDEHKQKLAEVKKGKRGPQANNWQGGKAKISSQGYLVGRFTLDGKRWYKHRYVATISLGRDLLRHEDVHHINLDRLDNEPSNLMVLGRADHNRLHRAIEAGFVAKADQIAWLEQNNIKYEVCDGACEISKAA